MSVPELLAVAPEADKNDTNRNNSLLSLTPSGS